MFIGAISADAANYYVTQSGSGSSNGASQANAWSVATFNSSTVPKGGDTVYFYGTISSTVRPNSNGSGNGASRLTLDFSGATLASANPRINLNGRKYLNVNGGTMASTTSETCISFGGAQSNDITIQNWKQTASETNTGAFVTANYCYNLEVLNNNIVNTRSLVMGDSVKNYNVRIANNYAMTSLNRTAQTDVIFLGDAYNVVIEGNKFVHRTEGAASVRHNDIIQCYKKGGSGGGNPGGWVIRYNWLELDVRSGSGDTSWLMLQHMNNKNGQDALKIYGNVFYGPPTDTNSNNGINVAYNVEGSVYRFYNNTVIRKNGPDNTIRFRSPGILYAQNNVGAAASGTRGTYVVWTMTKGKWGNNWFNNFGSVSSYTGTNGGTSDPQFVDFAGNNFSLKSTSPLIGKGDSSIGAEYSRGVARNATWPNPTLVTRSPWDIGAFASGGSTTTPEPEPSDTKEPTVTGLNAAPASDGAKITWTTDEPASSRVEYGTTTAYGSVATASGNTTTHSVEISGLAPSTKYQYRVVSTDAAGNTATSANGTFTTAPAAGQLAVEPGNLDFGRVPVGSYADLPITVKNTGGTSISGTASATAPFSVISGGSYAIAGGGTSTITVRYRPTTTAESNGTLTLTGGQGLKVPVTGTGGTVSSGLSAEAESGTITAPFVVSNGSIVQNVQTTSVSSAGKASYMLTVTEPGQYAVEFTLSAPTQASNSIFYNIDAEPSGDTMVWDIPVTSGVQAVKGGWRGTGTPDKNQITTKYFDLKAGVHELIVRGREAGVRIDKVALVKQAAAKIAFEAENGTIAAPFTVSNGQVSQSVQTISPSAGGRAAYKFNVTEPGVYVVKFSLGATSEASNSIFYNIDAEPSGDTMAWDIPVTSGVQDRDGGWRGTGTVTKNQYTPKYFELTTGTHELIIRGREARVSIDKIEIVKQAM